MKTAILVFLSFTLFLSSCCQKMKNLLFDIKLNSSIVSQEGDLNIQLLFKNIGDTNILVTRLLQHTYKKGLRPKTGDLVWEVESINENRYYEESVKTLFSPLPFYVPKGEQFDTLLPKKEIIKVFPLYHFYQLGVGSYRVRAKYIIPLEAKLPIKFLYSNWYKFNIQKEINYFSGPGVH